MVFANMPGRPMVKRIGAVRLFYVEPYLRHYGDINLSTGNQNFRGNIEVYGDICDGMTVRAGGNIQIMGSVNQAKVMAMESVIVGKCIGSLVQAGGDSHYIGKCYITLKELHADLKKLYSVVDVLLDNPKINKFQNQLAQIFLLIIEKKFSRIPRLLKETVHILEITPVDTPAEIKVLLDMIKDQIPPRNLTKNKLKILIEYVELAKEFFNQQGNVPADVQVDYAFNSVIAATNDVHIVSQGCFNTILRSDSGRVKILKKIYDGVVINVGDRKLEITETMGSVEFRNNDNKGISVINL